MPKISQYPQLSVLTGQELVLMDSGPATNRQTVTASTNTLSQAISSGIGLFDATHSGLTPASGGGTSATLRPDGTWSASFTGTWTFPTLNSTTIATTTIGATTGNIATVVATTVGATTGNITTVNSTTVGATTGNITTVVSTTGNIATVNATTIGATTGNITTVVSTTGNITTVNATTLAAPTGNITTVNATTVGATTGNITTVVSTTVGAATGNLTTVNSTTGNITTVNATTVAASSQVTIGGSAAPAFDSVTGNIGYYARTAAEIAASVTPTRFIFPPGDVRRYGADPSGVANSATAFANAFLVKGLVVAQGSFLINSQVSLDISTTSLVGPCTITSGLSANAGALLVVTASGQVEFNCYHKISQIQFVGQSLTGVQAINFNGASVPLAVDCFTVESCTFTHFADGCYVSNNSWEIEFHGCSFSQSGSDHAALYVHYVSSERVSCVQCAFFNNTEAIRVDGGGEVFLDNCSVDYSNRLLNASFGIIFACNCYFENGSTVGDLDYWFKTGTSDSTIVMSNCFIAQTAAKSSFNIGQSLSAYGGTLDFRNCKLYTNTNSIVNPIIGGSGNARCTGLLVDGFVDNRFAWGHYADTANFCSNGGFSKGAGGLGGWTVGSHTGTGGNPTTSGGVLLLQVAIGGQDQFATWTIAAEPGQNVGVSFSVKGNATTCSFGVIVTAFGADGVSLTTNVTAPGFNAFNGSSFPMPTGFTASRASIVNLPAGTASVTIEFNTGGATSNTNIVSVQTVIVGKF